MNNVLHRWFGGKAEKTVLDPYLVDANERIYAIGDVHGRVDLLNRILEMIARDVAEQTDGRTPKMVFLGDYIDRGDNSREALDVLLSVREDLSAENVVFLMGNHEEAALSFLGDPVGKSEWLRFGGLQTLHSYGVAPPKSNPEPADLISVADALRAAMGPHIDFLASMSGMVKSGDVVFVHAGLEPGVELPDQSTQATLWGRSDFIEEGGYDGLRVVHGHYDNAEPVIEHERVCVDTGAYYTGRLTAIRLDDAEKLIVADALDIF